jgi:CpeT protein
MRSHVASAALLVTAFAGLSISLALCARDARADTPLPPPRKYEAASPNKAVVAESDPATDMTTVFRVRPDGTRERAWAMPGWYRAIHTADDGDHLVLGFDGLNLLPRPAPPTLVVLRFVRRGEITRALTLADVLPDLSVLRPTASHLLWREGEGFDASGQFLLATADGVKHTFDIDGRELDAAGSRAKALGLDRLVEWMTGAFRNDKQAAADPDIRDASLHAVRVWKALSDAAWIYMEEAPSQALEAPYRQRVYRIRSLADGGFEAQPYDLPDPRAVVGAWRTGLLPGVAGPPALVVRGGCAVLLRADGETRFVGGTAGSQCAGAAAGAAYATTELTVSADLIVSWVRGYDAAGKQVFGLANGGYRFERNR